MRPINHVIPVGGVEPIHVSTGLRCWCSPMPESVPDGKLPLVVIHNAHDLRDARERNGVISTGGHWVIVQEINELDVVNTQWMWD